MTNEIAVEIRTVYGVDKIYPACAKAEVFCQLVNQKTLTGRDVDLIKQLGIEVKVSTESQDVGIVRSG